MRTLIAVLGLALSATATAQHAEFQVLAYHDVRDQVSGDFDPDQYAISTANLIDHFTWLRLNGFTVVSVDDILAARRGEAELPQHAVLLTFDDGFKSIATHVLPLLELFDYPAVVSVVTSWIDADPGAYQAGRELTRDDMLTWDQVRELSNHELIEIASHSHDLHRGIIGNPLGNEQPAAVTTAYRKGSYESPEDQARRVENDLATSIALIEQHTGRRPRVMTWPFGAYNESAIEIATKLGLVMTLTLADGINTPQSIDVVARHLIEANPGVTDLGWSLLYPTPEQLVRAAQVDLDYVYDADPAQQEENLGRLLDRIKAMRITHVFLQAFADPDADGGAQALYFPNRFLPVRADLFNRAAWQLQTRAGIKVYAWLPLLSFEGESIDPSWRVQQLIDGQLVTDTNAEPRLSPFSPQAREVISGIYQDLARHASIDGILFHDDGRFNEFEDWSEPALAAYRRRFGATFSIEALKNNSDLTSEWAAFRRDALIDLSLELVDEVRRYRPAIKTARDLFAPALLEPEPDLRLAQRYESFLEAYDHVAILAMPRFESYHDHRSFYARLVALATAGTDARNKVIFQLQTVDWKTGEPIDSSEIQNTLRHLQSLGIRHLAYYPDDFISGHPKLDAVRRGMSVAVYPWSETR